MLHPKSRNMASTLSDIYQYISQLSFGPIVILIPALGIDFNVARERPSLRLIFRRILGISSLI